jgi:hypothetical protein
MSNLQAASTGSTGGHQQNNHCSYKAPCTFVQGEVPVAVIAQLQQTMLSAVNVSCSYVSKCVCDIVQQHSCYCVEWNARALL